MEPFISNAESPQSTTALTLDQALQQAIAHHQAGRLQEAEQLYRAILQTRPNHPDANHNLGVLAAQMNQVAAGLPHFKAALESNPDQGQYWLSYIDALIQTGSNDAALQVFEQGRKRGWNGEAVELMAVRLRDGAQAEQANAEHIAMESLAALFKDGRYTEAAARAQSLTVRYPEHGFGWKILGSALEQMGRNEDALEAKQKAAALSPDDAEAHFNLGNTLRNNERPGEAAASYRRALEIKPDYAEAHYNLGNVLRDIGQLDAAVASYQRALVIKPDYAKAHYNLGNVLRDLRQLDAAVASYQRALVIKPDFAEAYSNLGTALQDLGQLDAAVASYQRALVIKPDFAEAHNNLGVTLQDFGQLDDAMASYQRALVIKPDYAEAHRNIGQILWRRGLLRESVYYFQQAFAKRVEWHAEGDKDLSSGLESVYIELTNKCNFHCDFCPSDFQQRTKDFINTDWVQRLYDEVAENNLAQEIHLHLMGEPTLHPDLIDILAYASSKNIKTSLVTNGSTLNTKTIQNILDTLYGSLIVSLQTPTRDTYKHRGDVGLSWDRYIANIRMLVQEYLKRIAVNSTLRTTLELRVMITKDSKLPANIMESYEDIRDVTHEWRDFVAEIEIEFGLPPYNRRELSREIIAMQTTQAEIKYRLQRGITLSLWRGFTFANSMLSSAYSLKIKKLTTFCNHPFNDVAVLANGDITLCCLDYDGKLAVGNIKDNTIKTILNSKPTMDLRAAMLGRNPLPLFCQQCQAEAVLSDKSPPSVL